MQSEIVIAGFGGQGVLFAGQLLAYTALDYDRHVTWFPSYGPEMRGGTANCVVIISDEEIGSPVVRNPQTAIVMNLPSMIKYEQRLKPGGLLVVNASMVDRQVAREDIQPLYIHANEEAEKIGSRRLMNLVLLGALLERSGILTIDQVSASLDHHIPEHHRKMLEPNRQALRRGAELAAATVSV